MLEFSHLGGDGLPEQQMDPTCWPDATKKMLHVEKQRTPTLSIGTDWDSTAKVCINKKILSAGILMYFIVILLANERTQRRRSWDSARRILCVNTCVNHCLSENLRLQLYTAQFHKVPLVYYPSHKELLSGIGMLWSKCQIS